MESASEILIEIKNILKFFKKTGVWIDQYDAKLFSLFIQAYKNNYMDSRSAPLLTADAIRDRLYEDETYRAIESKKGYDVDDFFSQKWSRWKEAFDKGFQGEYITWTK